MPPLQTGILIGLSAAEAAAVAALGTSTVLPAGQVLFELGAAADRVYQVTRGCINLTLPMQIRGENRDVLVEERTAGETLGWSGLVPPHRFTLKATATAETELVAFPRAALLEHFAANPTVGATVIRYVASVIGHRLQIFQAMWLREMQRSVDLHYS